MKKERDKRIPAFKYEHLIANQNKFIKSLFKCLNLELTEERQMLMTEALQVDSQKNTHGDRNKLKVKQLQITSTMIAEANKHLEYYQFPKWGEDFTAFNTVTSQ